MVVRLAFAVAIHVDPEILLVDEALAVGDIYFRQRCMRKVHELRARGITILFVSHAIGDVKAIGDRTLWLDQGADPGNRRYRHGGRQVPGGDGAEGLRLRDPAQAAGEGPPRRGRAAPPEIVDRIPNIDHRHGDGRAEVHRHRRSGSAGTARCSFWSRCRRIVVRISVRAKEEIAQPIVGFMLRNHLGIDFSGTNTARLGVRLAADAARTTSIPSISTCNCRIVSWILLLLAGHRRWYADELHDVRLDRQRHRACRWGTAKDRSTASCTCRAGWK